MASMGEDAYNHGFRDGKAEGITEGLAKAKLEGKLEGKIDGIIDVIILLVKEEGWSVDKAMAFTKIPDNYRERIERQLKEN